MLSIWISSKLGSERFTHASGPLEFGRGPQRGVARRVLADPTVSNSQLCIQALSDGQLSLQNLSQRVALLLADGTRIEPGAESVVSLPLRLHVGETLIEVASQDSAELEAAGTLRTIEPPVGGKSWGRPGAATRMSTEPDATELTRWFEALVSVQKAAASSPDFFTEVARAVVELIGLDRGMVLLRRGDDWQPVASFARDATDDDNEFSHSILETVLRERRTFFQGVMPTSSSLVGVSAVVASPIVGEEQRVIGVIYGVRRGRDASTEIRPLEAQLTQVLAAAVAAGLARLDSEAEAARRRVQFEQFFTPDLASELDRDPALLDGREREVTILFADIRGFSRVSERLTPRVACDLIRDIMEGLTCEARAVGGVVVDYQGDGLLAMWNAPLEQPDHAARACKAALAMHARLVPLNRDWEHRIGHSLGVGIGLNTGPALVGNTGSRTKFKYGPLGHTVNLASRVEGATKHLGINILITGSTRAYLGSAFATRRLCRARVVGIAGEVELHELFAERATPEWLVQRDAYERALEFYEMKRWGEACHILFPLLPPRHDAPGAAYDVPTLTLLGRTLDCLSAPQSEFDAVLELKAK